MRVQFVIQPKSGLSYHRLVNPMEFMQWEGDDHSQMLLIIQDEHLIDGDVLYFNKFIGMEPAQLRSLQKKGVKIVVDVDDSWELPVTHYFYKEWEKRENKEKVLECMRLADVVITTTDRLRNKILPLNKNVEIIPNAFPFGYDNYVPNPQPRDKTTFIYVAGASHLEDVKLLEGKFKRIKSDNSLKNNAEFVLAGYEPTMLPRYATKADYEARNGNYTMVKVQTVWDKMATIFSQTGAHRIQPSADLDSYINFYDQADVAIVPLQDSTWNSYKSELKIVEAGVKGIPVICSNVAPYSDLRPCEGVMWVEKPDQWLQWFKYCVKNPNYVKDQGAKLHEWVKEEYDLLKWNKVRYDILKSLMK